MTKLICVFFTCTMLALIVAVGRAGLADAARMTTATTIGETWRLGVISEDSAAVAAIHGQPLSIAAAFQSSRAAADAFFLFPASQHKVVVQSATFRLLRRSGSYTGSVTMTLEVRSDDGTLRRTLSSSAVDLQAAALDTWNDVALIADAAERTLAPDEHLVAHVARNGTAGGDLDVRPIFEVHTGPATTPTATETPIATETPTETQTPTITEPTTTSMTSPTPLPTATPSTFSLYLPQIQR